MIGAVYSPRRGKGYAGSHVTAFVCQIETFRRHPEGWWYELLNDPENDRLRFRCVDLALSVEDVHAGVDLSLAPQAD